MGDRRSPSARRVWIEILFRGGRLGIWAVTLRKEGVDWNVPAVPRPFGISCHPPQGGCGLKYHRKRRWYIPRCHPPQGGCGLKYYGCVVAIIAYKSPSARRVWIEIALRLWVWYPQQVTLRKEGVDWNNCPELIERFNICHPPQGGCGLKYSSAPFFRFASSHPPQGGCGLKLLCNLAIYRLDKSPSARRVWIEISWSRMT